VPLHDADGRSIGILGIYEDITEQKQAEEVLALNEKRLRQIIDLVPHFIFAKDRDGRFILVNQALADAYGYHGSGSYRKGTPILSNLKKRSGISAKMTTK